MSHSVELDLEDSDEVSSIIELLNSDNSLDRENLIMIKSIIDSIVCRLYLDNPKLDTGYLKSLEFRNTYKRLGDIIKKSREV